MIDEHDRRRASEIGRKATIPGYETPQRDAIFLLDLTWVLYRQVRAVEEWANEPTECRAREMCGILRAKRELRAILEREGEA